MRTSDRGIAMGNYTVKKIDDMEAAFLGGFKRARAELGVESFGVQVLDLPRNLDRFPEHDHVKDGQEEVYLLLRGSAEIEIDGERFALDEDTMIRVPADAKRTFYTGAEPARVLALGGVPGKAYEAPEVTKLGAPDPLARPAQPA
ncbi:MAG: cupin domain-containing protein [Thermoleophilaceae bacterium]